VENIGIVNADVTGSGYVGGISGSVGLNAVVNRSYFEGKVSGKEGVGGISGVNWGAK